ncbi:PAS domain S-box protein [Anditalea andensis]|uniref:histidine kinase n=1 Tax=Anditalea andensis TaxID=1048983 RepID=A0A074LET7_9BACT|nr:PAS domain S-box protein [Anditalea andensis]KEO72307.1 hypothetical protein EL17_16280 [Anditalea andensis]
MNSEVLNNNNEKCFKAIVEHSNDVISILSSEGKYVYVSPSIGKVLGYSDNEAMMLDVHTLTHPDEKAILIEAWNKMLNTVGIAISVQPCRIRHRDGTWRWIASSITNLLHHLDINGVLQSFRDITDSVALTNQNLFDKNNLEALINNTHDFMWSVDRNFKLITTNNAFVEVIKKFTGNSVSRGDSVFIDGFSKDQHDKYKKIFERVFEGEVIKEVEYRDQPIEGWSEIKYYPIWDNNTVIGAACHSKDISSIKKAEQRRRFDKNNLDALINSTVDIMWSMDSNLGLITYNQPFRNLVCNFTGKEVERGMNIFAMDMPSEISQDLVFRYKEYHRRGLSGEVFSVVDHFNFPREMWLQVSFHPIRLEDAIIGVACHSQDITEIKKVEQERIRNETRLKESQALAKLGHWELDLVTGESLWSEESCRIYGVPVEDNRQSFETWLSFIHPDDMTYVMSEIEKSQKTFSDSGMSHRILLRDGTVKHISSKTKFEFDHTGKVPVGIYGVAYDITAEKVAEMQLKQKARELELINAELEQFGYAVSHDLQEPLRMVTSFLSQLDKKYKDVLDDKGKQYIYFAVDGAKRMRQIILDMLEYSRVGKTNEATVEVDLSEVMEGIKVLLKSQIEEKKAIVQYEKLPVIRSKKAPINQVFQNLIGNGLKYTAEEVIPHIIIEVKDNKKQWIISVSDNGIGINEAHYDKVFAIFQRLHNKEEYSGTGIGLALTKKIIDHLGGEIWLESEEGKGSVFFFTLPK